MQSAKKKLAFVTVIFWFLLAYIMAALVWWFVSLDQQNNDMALLRLSELNPAAANYAARKADVLDYQRRKHGQYVGEGIIFMLLIWVGALFVYLATRRYLRLGQQQQNFMMAVTHELKTPIAVARLNIETMQRRKLDDAQRDRLLQMTLNETERLNDLCDNILLASRFDSGQQSAQQERFSLDQLVNDIVDQYNMRFPDRDFSCTVQPQIWVYGDPFLIRLLLNNLIDNAMKYAPKNSTIDVSLKLKNQVAKLRVADQGKGIPAEEKKKVFDKFYRMGNEQTRNTKGTGLGLYLVKRIAERHDGTVEITDNVPQGSIFTIRSPLDDSTV